MDAALIRSLVASDQTLTNLRNRGDYLSIAKLLNDRNLKLPVSMVGGPGYVMRCLGPTNGAALLDQLAASTDPAVRWAMTLINRGELDFGDAMTRAMVDQLCPPAVAAALKAGAEVRDTTDHMEVAAALKG